MTETTPIYWVVGGEYGDTHFIAPAAGKVLERHGPYRDYDLAHDRWAERAWATVDDCHMRFRIVLGTDDGPGDGPALADGVPPRS